MNRKKPYSGAKKKKQLQEKRAKQRGEFLPEKPPQLKKGQKFPKKDNPQLKGLRTVFEKETKEEVEARKLLAMQPIVRNSKNFEKKQYFGESLDIPIRPEWNYEWSKDKLEAKEEKYFQEYLDHIFSQYPKERLNYFERNLNVWRQLWRVCETSDIFCILADVRHPIFHFPPSLYRYIHDMLKKPMILVLTKADLVPIHVVEKWIAYFKNTFPSLEVISVNSFNKYKVDLGTAGKKKKRLKMSAKNRYNGTWVDLIELLNRYITANHGQPLDIPEKLKLPTEENLKKEIESEEEEESADRSDVDSDHEEDESKDEREEKGSEDEEESDEDCEESENDKKSKKKGAIKNIKKDEAIVEEVDDEFYIDPAKRTKKPYITIGFIGSPNVGKSTLINAFKGRKICSESRTPGHTKHRQTIFINPTVVFADCPGLVFPAVDIPKQMQILCGIFPVSQVREPYSTIQYLAEHVPIEEIYKLKKLEGEEYWSAFGICESYATKRGFFTKNGRANTHKAGCEILFDIIDGRIEWFFEPESADININTYQLHSQEKLYDDEEKEEEKEELDVEVKEEEKEDLDVEVKEDNEVANKGQNNNDGKNNSNNNYNYNNNNNNNNNNKDNAINRNNNNKTPHNNKNNNNGNKSNNNNNKNNGKNNKNNKAYEETKPQAKPKKHVKKIHNHHNNYIANSGYTSDDEGDSAQFSNNSNPFAALMNQ
jgi:ribosome biogenesis GTPase A